GAAGFIGSNLVHRLLADGHQVTAYDNFSTGQRPFLAEARRHPAFCLVEGDVLDLLDLKAAVVGHDFVFHLAANADVRFGTHHPRKDLEQNTIATYNVLEAMLAVEKADRPFTVLNLGTDEYCTVDDSLGWICGHLGLSPRRVYTGGERGWIGDNPFIFLDTARVRALGWRPKLTIREAVLRTLEYLQQNRWVYAQRDAA